MPPDTMVCLRQTLLPFFDPISGATGWQFGMAAQPQKGNFYKDLSANSKLSVLILYEDGTTQMHPFPIYRAATKAKPTLPPLPLWGWVSVELEDGSIGKARVVEPSRTKGSVPLTDLAQHRRPATFYTPAGLERTGAEPTVFDLDRTLRSEEVGVLPLQLGDTELGTAIVYDNADLGAIVASKTASDMGLWTCHLVRVFEVLYGTR